MNENLISTKSTNDDEYENNSKEEDKEIKMNKTIINQITEILKRCKTSKQKEEITCEELLNFVKENNLNLMDIKDSDNSTLIQIYCSNREDYYLKCILFCLEKLSEKKDITSYLLNENNSKENIFEKSSEIGDIKIFRILRKYLEENQNILNHLINEGRRNIFHISADKNKVISLLFFYSFYYNNISYLNIANQSGWTPLHLACYKGNYEYSQYLINLGVNIDSFDNYNKTPLFYAVQSNNSRLVKFLILNGADKNVKDKNNKKAIEYTGDKIIYDILENKNIFRIAFKCETNYQSLKNDYRNYFMLILSGFLIFLQFFIIIKFESSDVKEIYSEDKKFSFELVLIIFDIIFEIIIIGIYIFFQIMKKNKINSVLTNNQNPDNNNNNQFCIKENGIEYFELFKYNENICVKCRRVKEMNTKHCIACDICIDSFDHHCFFLNTCIYNKNKIYFKIFLFESLATVLLNLISSLVFFIDFIKYPKIYYFIIHNDDDFDKNRFYEFIIYLLDILYFLLSLFLILASIIPFLFDLLDKKHFCSIGRKNTGNDKSNSPLLPIDGIKV